MRMPSSSSMILATLASSASLSTLVAAAPTDQQGADVAHSGNQFSARNVPDLPEIDKIIPGLDPSTGSGSQDNQDSQPKPRNVGEILNEVEQKAGSTDTRRRDVTVEARQLDALVSSLEDLPLVGGLLGSLFGILGIDPKNLSTKQLQSLISTAQGLPGSLPCPSKPDAGGSSASPAPSHGVRAWNDHKDHKSKSDGGVTGDVRLRRADGAPPAPPSTPAPPAPPAPPARPTPPTPPAPPAGLTPPGAPVSLPGSPMPPVPPPNSPAQSGAPVPPLFAAADAGSASYNCSQTASAISSATFSSATASVTGSPSVVPSGSATMSGESVSCPTPGA